MQSSMKNQRSSPARPFLRDSARHVFSLGLLACHFARMSRSFSRVSFFESDAAGAVPCADAATGRAMIAADIKAAVVKRTHVRNIGFPLFFCPQNGRRRETTGVVPRRPKHRQKILTALTSVVHTPQASGIPTNSQNKAALASRPPKPIPCEPVEAADLALAA